MSALADAKAAARKAAFARRGSVHGVVGPGPALRALSTMLSPWRGRVLAGYMPIRTEIDPMPVMSEWAETAPVCVPVIDGAGKPLRFRAWTAHLPMIDGPFGPRIPESGDWITPEVLIVPLVAFDAHGGRLGYGGGFYDRTLAALRAEGDVAAVGFAYAAQQADALPRDATDQTLDAVVTEARSFGRLVPPQTAGGPP